ncbi:DinB family protein [Alicyclobacillus sp.]|uniref:DinB family protein n=1 Tax=Alicyclobacillus sp. TaxID=61169 RepID=UPI0025C62C68|nr:DinB family protein [Alicyclobacillus sp.]MCL6516277.1 DinB family protein [Alicyclobacillus sp.]
MEEERWSEVLRRYEQGPVALAKAVEGLGDEALDWRPRPGKWSIRQIVVHLADTEMVYTHRMRRAVAEPGSLLTVFDQDRWVDHLFASKVPVRDAIAVISAIRAFHIHTLRRLSPAALTQTGTHETDGPVTAAELCQKVTDHLYHHLAQIEERRAALHGR